MEVERLIPAENIAGDIFHISRDEIFKGDSSVLHKIQFSAANRVCIFLTYNGKQRIVEPLSFRTSVSRSNRLFFGYEREVDHVKAYIISKIQSVEISNLPYTEKYPVEISPTRTISMPPLRRSTGRSSTTGLRTPNRRSTSSSHPYKVQCPVCQKIFPRKRASDTKLNKHKNQYGAFVLEKGGIL